MNVTHNPPNKGSALKKVFYALAVFSSATLATWTMGETLSVGGFTAMEISLLVVYSSLALKIATVFWNAVFWNATIDFAVRSLQEEPLVLTHVVSTQNISQNEN